MFSSTPVSVGGLGKRGGGGGGRPRPDLQGKQSYMVSFGFIWGWPPYLARALFRGAAIYFVSVVIRSLLPLTWGCIYNYTRYMSVYISVQICASSRELHLLFEWMIYLPKCALSLTVGTCVD